MRFLFPRPISHYNYWKSSLDIFFRDPLIILAPLVAKIISVARNDKFKPERSRFIEITSDPWLKWVTRLAGSELTGSASTLLDDAPSTVCLGARE